MPKIILPLILWISALGLTACSTFSTDVIPQSGPTMEQVYDGTDKNTSSTNDEKVDVKILRQQTYQPTLINHRTTRVNEATPIQSSFHKLPNPALQLYVYPHLAGDSEVPIPGYYTTVSMYERDHYALPSEVASR